MNASTPATATRDSADSTIGTATPNLTFVDKFATSHRLDPGHRDRIKPGWKKSLSQDVIDSYDGSESDDVPAELLPRIRLGLHMLGMHGCSIRNRDVVIIGCGGWEEIVCLLGHGAKSVVGIDSGLSESLIGEAHIANDASLSVALEQPAAFCESIRRFSAWQPTPGAAATLVRGDIHDCDLPGESADVVVSWRTLEHIADPKSALREMQRICRPGGYAFHEYNPFFCIEGGHALVTLDIPWGHVRLTGDDVRRYLETIRPNEAARAWHYYRNCLNRMSTADLQRFCTDAAYEILTFLPRARTEDVLELTQQVFDEARNVYPAITTNDLVCRIVRVVLRKNPAR